MLRETNRLLLLLIYSVTGEIGLNTEVGRVEQLSNRIEGHWLACDLWFLLF